METFLWVLLCALCAAWGFAAGVVYALEAQHPELKANRWAGIKAALREMLRKTNTK
ncbi:MAG: hypothetical protein NTX28_07690 [Novosphingobium sp.]|nr:hypothetical protein [Novosphingobium sp.]